MEIMSTDNARSEKKNRVMMSDLGSVSFGFSLEVRDWITNWAIIYIYI